MAHLSISLLGVLRIARDGEPVTGFANDKARALLAYLAVEADRPHQRDALAELLWPDRPQRKARQNLRQALSDLRKAVGDCDDAPFFLVSRESIQFNPRCDHWLDVAAFVKLVGDCEKHHHRRAGACLPCIQRMARMVDLHSGPFLEQFFLSDSAPFEEWAVLNREWMQHEVTKALSYLATYCERRGDYRQARRYAQRKVQMEPWHEEAHRQLMRSLALDGQRSAALTQYETCRRALDKELGVEPTEETQALYEKIRAAERGGGGAEGATPPLPRTSAPLHILPPSPTPFVGREVELAEVSELLANPDCRLVTLFGPGGIGKTRLALQVAADHLGIFEDGAAFVPLAPIDDAKHFIPTLASNLGVSFHGEQDPKEQVLNYLRQKELLLVLDNVEHILECADFIAVMLQRSPGLVLLVTSRERLNLPEEWVYDVEGLAYPTEEELVERGTYSAIDLFVQRSRGAPQYFVLDETTWPHVARICRLVEGMPLAVELAAAWVGVRSCEEIAQEIARGLDPLTTRLRNVPERHRSIRAAFEHSWQLLSDAERALLAQLSVFRGGFRQEAAIAVTGTTLPPLLDLLDKSLIRQVAPDRYGMHQLLRQYAAEKLTEFAPQTGTIFYRHADYYAAFLREREEALKGGGQREALQEIAVEIDNVRRAWRWAVTQIKNERNTTQALAVLAQAAESLYLFYTTRDWYQEGKEAFNHAVLVLADDAAAGRKGLLLGRLLAYQGKCCEFTEHSDKAPQLFEQSLEIFQRLEARRETALPLHGLGYMAHIRGEYEQAERYFQDSMAIYSEMEDAWGIANAHRDLCLVARRQGAFLRAKQHAQEALAIRREIGDQVGTAAVLSGLGLVDCDLGEYAEAKKVLLEALELCRQLDYKVGIADTLTGLCQAAFRLGEVETAQQFGQQSLTVHQEIGDYWGVAIAFNNLGYMAAELGDYTQAKRFYQEGVALFQQIGIKAGLVNTLGNLGEACYNLGEYAEARKYLHQALQIGREIGAIPTMLESMVSLAALWAQEGKTARSLELLACAMHQPAITQDAKEQARALSAELAAELSSDVVAEAKARGQACELDALVAEILHDADGSAPPSPATR